MRTIQLIVILLFLSQTQGFANIDSLQHISKLEIGKKKKKVFTSRDSTLTLIIDTLIMKDKSKMIFYGKKSVTLKVKHAIIGHNTFIFGTDGKNNGSDMDITIHFTQLKSLAVSALGLDAFNGTRTHPNGNGGNIDFKYLDNGVIPQTTNKKASAYLSIENRAGGYSVNARSDINNILSQIGGGTRPLGRLPQGQIYSGSAGIDGKTKLQAVSSFEN